MLLRHAPESDESRAFVRRVSRQYPGARVEPALDLPREIVRDLVRQARRRSPGVNVPDLTRFVRIRLPERADAAAVVRWAQAQPEVESAEVTGNAIAAASLEGSIPSREGPREAWDRSAAPVPCARAAPGRAAASALVRAA